ncbi:hypothetical protein GGR53DRAFT_451226 [Hypoxylon sp. FL1150]|nr:hypothetical protein GGR53DRAFT_451226 [Hypoxylon sp. FL1150]
MGDTQPPSPAKRKLPFKRTVRRKSSEVANDDGLSLFKRSGDFFEEQQRLAQEKAEAEKAAREAKAARREQERKERLAREEQAKEVARNNESAKKRRRSSISDDAEEHDSDSGLLDTSSAKRQKSPSAPRTPTSKRQNSFVDNTKGSGGRLTRSQSRKTGTPVISLEDEDDDDPEAVISPTKRSKTRRMPEILELEPASRMRNRKIDQDVIALDDDSDTQFDIAEGRKEGEKEEKKEEDPSEYYVRLAMERARKAKEEREARENGTGEIAEDPVVSILIHSHLEGIHTLMFRRKLSQQLTVVYNTWVEQQVAKHSVISRPILQDMFFTWKGNKVYPNTSLRTLGIKPEQDGNLYPSWKSDQEGYHGRDRVLFEAWTQELYEEYLEEKRRQRLRDKGELLDDEEPGEKQESEQPENSQADKKIRVQFKAKNAPVKNATVRSSTTAAQLVKVYRRLAEIPENMTIELRWDGEVLEPDTTVEEADIEDMDSIEVHVK